MNDSQPDLTPRHLSVVSALATAIIAGDPTTSDRTTVDVEAELLASAQRVLRQLHVVQRLSPVPGVGLLAVETIMNLARARDGVVPGAVGVTAVLADLLREPEERLLAATLVRAREAFGDDELLLGAAALDAACAMFIAAALGVDPLDVQSEVQGSIRRARVRTSVRHRSLVGRRCDRGVARRPRSHRVTTIAAGNRSTTGSLRRPG